MAKNEYESWLKAPNHIAASNIAGEAHARVFGVLNSVINDKRVSEVASRELKAVRKEFGDKTTIRLFRPSDVKEI